MYGCDWFESFQLTAEQDSESLLIFFLIFEGTVMVVWGEEFINNVIQEV
jgi:hypothetical protein